MYTLIYGVVQHCSCDGSTSLQSAHTHSGTYRDVKLEQWFPLAGKPLGLGEKHLDNIVPQLRILATSWGVPTASAYRIQSTAQLPVQNTHQSDNWGQFSVHLRDTDQHRIRRGRKNFSKLVWTCVCVCLTKLTLGKKKSEFTQNPLVHHVLIISSVWTRWMSSLNRRKKTWLHIPHECVCKEYEWYVKVP